MTLEDSKLFPLNGLVLTGGKSTRMGKAKDQIKWYDKQQRYYLADLLYHLCEEVFISCRPDQVKDIETGYSALSDTFLGFGPLSGMLSALRWNRKTAWLVVACDLPLLNESTIQYLIQHRDPQKIATTYVSPHDGLPEPLITIWEPASYPVLLEFLSKGITCPRKALINSDVLALNPLEPQALMNVNTPDEAASAKALLNRQ